MLVQIEAILCFNHFDWTVISKQKIQKQLKKSEIVQKGEKLVLI